MGFCPLQPPLGKGQGEACLALTISCLDEKNQDTLAGSEAMDADPVGTSILWSKGTRKGGLLPP